MKLMIVVALSLVATSSALSLPSGPGSILVRCYMNLWSVAVHELDSHPDHNKGQDHALVHKPIP